MADQTRSPGRERTKWVGSPIILGSLLFLLFKNNYHIKRDPRSRKDRLKLSLPRPFITFYPSNISALHWIIHPFRGTYFARSRHGLRLESQGPDVAGWRRRHGGSGLWFCHWLYRIHRPQFGLVFSHLLQLDLSGQHLLDAVREAPTIRDSCRRSVVGHLLNIPVKSNIF